MEMSIKMKINRIDFKFKIYMHFDKEELINLEQLVYIPDKRITIWFMSIDEIESILNYENGSITIIGDKIKQLISII